MDAGSQRSKMAPAISAHGVYSKISKGEGFAMLKGVRIGVAGIAMG